MGSTEVQVEDEIVYSAAEASHPPKLLWGRRGGKERGTKETKMRRDGDDDSPEDREDEQTSSNVHMCTCGGIDPRMYMDNHGLEHVECVLKYLGGESHLGGSDVKSKS